MLEEPNEYRKKENKGYISDANSMQTFGLLHSFHIVLFGIFFLCAQNIIYSTDIECNFDSLIKCVPMK